MRFLHSVGIAMVVGTLAGLARAQDPVDGAQGFGTGYERELRNWAYREQASLRSCIESGARRPSDVLAGLQFVSLSVGPDGSVSHVTMHGRPDVVAPLELCVNRITSSWRLTPPTAGPVSVDLNRDQLLEGANWIVAH